MSLQIGCPKCGKQLNASPSLVGKVVACPRCENRFRIGEVETGAETKESRSTNPHYYPPGEGPQASGAATDTDTAEAEPDVATKPDTEPVPEEPTRPKPAESHHTARFIKRDPNATQVQLGEDGQLPDLALSEQKKREGAGEGTKSASPLLLIGVLVMSVVMSVLILVIDEPVAGTSENQMTARQTIENIYETWEPDEPADREILDLLALAIQAYNRGDLKQERAYYRQVLNLLNREDAPRYGGYSGDDETIKEALGRLLR